jgi:hypothetical protein
MGRVFGSILIFAGWASLPLGALSGLVASGFLGLNTVDEALVPTTVYGISAAVVLWVFVAAALISAIPLAMAIFAVDPRRSIYATAGVMAVVGLAMVPDELGRSFGFPILAGSAAMAFGGLLLVPGTEPGAAVAATEGGSPTPTWIFDTIDLAGDGDPNAVAEPAGEEPADTPVQTPEPSRPAAPAATTPKRRKSIGKGAAEADSLVTCQWCSSVIPAAATTCPTCGVQLGGPDSQLLEIPGVTEISPTLRAYDVRARTGKKRPSLLRTMFSDTPVPQAIDAPPPSDAAALQPPSRELRAEMARLDAEIAAGAVDASSERAAAPATEPAEAVSPAAADTAAEGPGVADPAASTGAAAADATPPPAAPSRRDPRT